MRLFTASRCLKVWVGQPMVLAAFLAVGLNAAAAPEVAVQSMGAQSVSNGYVLDGQVEPVRQSTVSAQASGRVAALLVKAGERVKAGQVLATIDDRDTQSGLARSQAQVAQADAELAQAKANWQRQQELKAKGFVSQAALDVAATQYKAAQAGRDGAGAGARQAGLAQAFTKVTAPFDGFVFDTLVQAGDLAVLGKPIAVVYAPQPLRVVVQVPASMNAQAQAAQQIEFQVTGANGQTTWVKPLNHQAVGAADPVSQTMTWKMEVPTAAAAQMIPGQPARVRFVGAPVQRMVVPRAAVLQRGELTAVYVATPQGFALKAVRLGQDHGAAGVEILAGLSASDAVAVDAIKAGLAGAKAAGSTAKGQ
ncbi:MAG: efflux RND transporter periplasmic adaptor subunit [Limnohabitans sp.]